MSRESAPRVISMADYLARRGTSGQTTRPEDAHQSSATRDMHDGDTTVELPPGGLPAIIPFPAPRHPLPAA